MGRKFNALDGRLPTLAERMQEQGYQTASLSGNPVLMKASGLLRGFDHFLSADTFGQFSGKSLVDGLRELLDAGVDPAGGPLFLFVNIADAHTPWSAVPNGVTWLESQPALQMNISKGSAFQRYVSGELTESEASALRTRYTNAYDYGVFRADQSLGWLLDELELRGWFQHGRRIVITSDHGEFLGDHGLVGHGVYLYEGNARVPFLYLGEGPKLELPERFRTVESYRISLGRPPRTTPWVQAVSFPSHRKASAFDEASSLYRHSSAVLWSGDEKLRWMDGTMTRYNLASDPQELSPQPLAGHPMRAQLEALAQRALAAAEGNSSPNDELAERLRALGYAE